MPLDPTDPVDPFARIDRARLVRHEHLLAIWRQLPLDDLIADLVVLTQFVGVRAARWTAEDLVLDEAKKLQEAGGTHDCTEWCALCGHRR